MRAARLAGLLLLCLSLLSVSPASARVKKESHRHWCQRVREAIWAGHTLEQLTAEFDADALQIVKCLPRGKGKKPRASAAKPASTGRARTHK